MTETFKKDPTPPLPPPTPDPRDVFKDVYVHGYERVEKGVHEYVRAHWRGGPNAPKPPMTKEKADALKKFLTDERNRWNAAEERDGKELERFKRQLREATTDEEKYQANANIEKTSAHLVIDHQAITDISGRIRQL